MPMMAIIARRPFAVVVVVVVIVVVVVSPSAGGGVAHPSTGHATEWCRGETCETLRIELSEYCLNKIKAALVVGGFG
jgi:preprotein translocase subunit SecG